MIEYIFIFFIFFNLFVTVILVFLSRAGFSLVLHTVFQVFFIGLPAYFQIKIMSYPWTEGVLPTKSEQALIVMMYSVYSIFFLMSYVLTKRRRQYGLKSLSKNLNIKNSDVVFYLLLIIPVFYLVDYLGWGTFFKGRSSVAEIVYTSEAFIPMIYILLKFSYISLLLFIALVWVDKKRIYSGNKYLLLASLVFIIIINLIINGPFSSPRFHFLALLIIIFLAFGFFNGRISNFIFLLLSPVFLYFIFPLIKHLGAERAPILFKYSDYLSKSVDFDAYQQMFNIYRYVQESGYSYGANFIGGISFFIPRVFWENKPKHLGQLSSEFAGYSYTNLSAPLIGEFYYSLGWSGIILGSILMGFLLKKIDRELKEKSNLLLYGESIILASFLFITLRGAFGSVFPAVSVSLVSFLILYFINRLNKFSI